MRKPE